MNIEFRIKIALDAVLKQFVSESRYLYMANQTEIVICFRRNSNREYDK